jgi:hypothetical protein
MVISPITVRRTLILTHLRREGEQEEVVLRMAEKFWRCQDKAFGPNGPFDRKLSLVEEGSRLPVTGRLLGGEAIVFSWTGMLDDRTPPPGYEHLGIMEQPIFTALDHGYSQPGENLFVMGGGNLDLCLLNTFSSLARIKRQQHEPLTVLIPLAMVYCFNRNLDLVNYARRPVDYLRRLEKMFGQNLLNSYRVMVDGQLVYGEANIAADVELHWFTSLNRMFASSFFPESHDLAVQQRLVDYFSDHYKLAG